MPLRTILADMTDPRRNVMLAIYDEYTELFHYAAGSSHNHQAWQGGYADHIAECLRINTVVFDALNNARPLPFTENSAAICLFFHDIEKPFRYGPKDHPECIRWDQEARSRDGEHNTWKTWETIKWEILRDLATRFGFDLAQEELNALKYTHGEGNDHRKDKRVAGPLAAHVHHCDNISARIWFDEGKGLSL